LERITIGLCTNALGTEKLNPIVIGKYRRPRCFKNISNINNLGITYEHNKNAWMTGTLFKQWITNVDNQISIKTPGRKILMIMDNATCHVIPELVLQSINILFLPPKTTSVLQPLDAGIIASFKTKYKSKFIRHLLEQRRQLNLTPSKLNILEAIRFITRSWDEVTCTTIQNCWAHTALISREALSFVVLGSSNELIPNEQESVLVNESGQLQELINDLAGENQLDIHAYLNIETMIMNDEDNQLNEHEISSTSSVEIEVDSDIQKQEIQKIYCSEALKATKTLIQFLQQQPEDQSQWIRDLTRLQREIERKQSKNSVQTSLLDFSIKKHN
jgi:DDE superfamily endonuclease